MQQMKNDKIIQLVKWKSKSGETILSTAEARQALKSAQRSLDSYLRFYFAQPAEKRDILELIGGVRMLKSAFQDAIGKTRIISGSGGLRRKFAFDLGGPAGRKPDQQA